MEKIILSAASFYKKSYYFNNLFKNLPTDVKNEIRIMSTVTAEKIHGIFSLGFYINTGNLFLETIGEDNDFDYDELGAVLEIKKIEREKKELLQSLGMWYALSNDKKHKKILNQ